MASSSEQITVASEQNNRFGANGTASQGHDDQVATVFLGTRGGKLQQEKTRARIDWMLAQQRGQSALDLGCSQGILAVLLARQGRQVLGVDINPRALADAATLLAEEPELVAWAGLTIPRLVRTARELGWTGLEGLVGIPGQVGGGAAMNAGGRWGDLWDVVRRVSVLTPEGVVEERTKDEVQPRYRDGNLHGAVVLGVHFVLERGDPAAIRAAIPTVNPATLRGAVYRCSVA